MAHFLIRLLFCLFAEDIGLLPERLFPRLLDQTRHNAKDFAGVLRQLFRAMQDGGYFGADDIRHFNGGLFDDDRCWSWTATAMDIIANIDALDWGSHRAFHLRHAVRARPRPLQALPAWARITPARTISC